MKTKYNVQNLAELNEFKRNVIRLLRKSFINFSFLSEKIMLDNINSFPSIDEYSDEEKRLNPKLNRYPYFKNWNVIIFTLPVQSRNDSELLRFSKFMKKEKMVFSSEPIFRLNQSSNKSEYSKQCLYEIYFIMNFMKGGKEVNQIIEDNQLKLF